MYQRWGRGEKKMGQKAIRSGEGKIPLGDNELMDYMVQRYGTKVKCVCGSEEAAVINDQMEDSLKLFKAGSRWFGQDWYLDSIKVLYVQAKCCNGGASERLLGEFESLLVLLGVLSST